MEKHDSESEKDIIRREVDNALNILHQGGIILYPTDTIWGIGCDATNAEAVARIYRLKNREDSKSMLVLLDSVDSLYKWLDNVPQTAISLIDAAENPLTIIYDSPRGVAANLKANDGSLGIRITSECFSRELCRHLGRPLVSTSANISGYPAAPLFKDISAEIVRGVDYVINYRRNDTNSRKPSGIIKVSDDETFKIIR